MPEEKPEPLPPGGYDDRDLPPQGDPDAPRCHRCDSPRAILPGGWLVCPRCDRVVP